MRIALVCPYSLDLPGGVQTQVLGMAAAFARHHEVVVIAPGTSTPEMLSAAGVTTVILGRTIGVRANGSVAPITLSLRAFARLRRCLAELDPEIVIIHEPLVPIVSLAAVLSATGVRIGTFHRAGASRAFRSLRIVAAPIIRRLDAGVVVSEEARATVGELVAELAPGFALLANAVDVARFAARTPEERRAKSVLFIGRHEPRKGLAVLLEAFAKLPADFNLRIAGFGPQTGALKQLVPESDRVHWLGVLDNAQIVQQLHEAEVFVAPAIGGESFGVVLLEAMAAGVPVIASDLPGYRLAAGDVARYVTPGDAAGFAEVIRELADDPFGRESMARAGHERVRACTFEDLCERYLALAEDVGHGGARSR